MLGAGLASAQPDIGFDFRGKLSQEGRERPWCALDLERTRPDRQHVAAGDARNLRVHAADVPTKHARHEKETLLQIS